jgi:hypothetical protein
MQRRNWLGPAAILLGTIAACRTPPKPDLFLPAVGPWRRTSLRDVPASEAPDPVPRTAIDWLETANYEGPGKLEARVYALESSAIALDLVQRWRPSADTIFFYRDRYFVVVKWEQADRQALQTFVRALQTRLGKPNEPS